MCSGGMARSPLEQLGSSQRLTLCPTFRHGTTPNICRVGFRFGLRSQGKSPAEVHAALSRKRSRHGLQAPTLKRLRGALHGITYCSRTETRGGVDLGRGVRE